MLQIKKSLSQTLPIQLKKNFLQKTTFNKNYLQLKISHLLYPPYTIPINLFLTLHHLISPSHHFLHTTLNFPLFLTFLHFIPIQILHLNTHIKQIPTLLTLTFINQYTLIMIFTFFPSTFITFTIRPCKFTKSFFFIVMIPSLINFTIRPCKYALTMHIIINPVTCVCLSIIPFITTLTLYIIHTKLSFIP